jgi:hypothetical protein
LPCHVHSSVAGRASRTFTTRRCWQRASPARGGSSLEPHIAETSLPSNLRGCTGKLREMPSKRLPTHCDYLKVPMWLYQGAHAGGNVAIITHHCLMALHVSLHVMHFYEQPLSTCTWRPTAVLHRTSGACILNLGAGRPTPHPYYTRCTRASRVPVASRAPCPAR